MSVNQRKQGEHEAGCRCFDCWVSAVSEVCGLLAPPNDHVDTPAQSECERAFREEYDGYSKRVLDLFWEGEIGAAFREKYPKRNASGRTDIYDVHDESAEEVEAFSRGFVLGRKEGWNARGRRDVEVCKRVEKAYRDRRDIDHAGHQACAACAAEIEKEEA